MAGNAVIGALRVVLGADTAALETGLKDAQSSLSSFGSNAGKTLAAAAVAMTAALTGVAVSIRSSLTQFDEMGKAAQRIGIPVEQLSALKYAGDFADVSLETLSTSVTKLARNMSDAVTNGIGPAANAFRAMHVQVTNSDGTLRNQADVIADVAEKFKYYEDGAAKTALAVAIFGKQGATMIPLLNGGRDALISAAEEAKKFGLIVDESTAKAAERFNDNLTLFGKVAGSWSTRLAAELARPLADLTDRYAEFLKTSQTGQATLTAVANTIKVVAASMATLAMTTVAAAQALIGLVGGIIKLKDLDFSGAWDSLKNGATSAYGTLSGALGMMKDVTLSVIAPTSALGDSWRKAGDEITAMGDKVSAAGEAMLKRQAPIIAGAKNAIQTFIDAKNKQIAAFQAEASTLGQSNIVQQQAKIVAEGLATAQANHIPITQALKDKLQALAETWAMWNERANFGKQIFEQTRTPAEQFAATMERLNIAFDYGKTNADLYARGVAQAQQQLVQADPAAQALGNSLETAFGKAIDGSSKFSDILKGLLQDLTKAMANQAFKQLLYGGQGGTSGGALGSLFSGVFGGGQSSYSFGGVNVPVIGGSGDGGLFSSIGKLFGFASGGSFDVGGSGGIDSQLVAFRASPNENVSVTKPGQGGGGDANVIVNNYGGSQVETRKKKNQDGGFDIEILIDRQVGALARRPGSNTNRALTDAFGAEQRLVGR